MLAPSLDPEDPGLLRRHHRSARGGRRRPREPARSQRRHRICSRHRELQRSFRMPGRRALTILPGDPLHGRCLLRSSCFARAEQRYQPFGQPNSQRCHPTPPDCVSDLLRSGRAASGQLRSLARIRPPLSGPSERPVRIDSGRLSSGCGGSAPGACRIRGPADPGRISEASATAPNGRDGLRSIGPEAVTSQRRRVRFRGPICGRDERRKAWLCERIHASS